MLNFRANEGHFSVSLMWFKFGMMSVRQRNIPLLSQSYPIHFDHSQQSDIFSIHFHVPVIKPIVIHCLFNLWKWSLLETVVYIHSTILTIWYILRAIKLIDLLMIIGIDNETVFVFLLFLLLISGGEDNLKTAGCKEKWINCDEKSERKFVKRSLQTCCAPSAASHQFKMYYVCQTSMFNVFRVVIRLHLPMQQQKLLIFIFLVVVLVSENIALCTGVRCNYIFEKISHFRDASIPLFISNIVLVLLVWSSICMNACCELWIASTCANVLCANMYGFNKVCVCQRERKVSVSIDTINT